MARYQPNSLFRHGENVFLNACVGLNGGPYDYGDFSRGYIAAANHLVDALADGDKPPLWTDIAVYPIVSNYRHGIELGIKHALILQLQILGRPTDFPRNHSLQELWDLFLNLEGQIQDGLMPPEDRDFVTAVVQDFMVTDPVAQVFRYPEDRRRNLQIDAFECINLQVLQECMQRVSEILESLDAYLGTTAESVSVSSRSVPLPQP